MGDELKTKIKAGPLDLEVVLGKAPFKLLDRLLPSRRINSVLKDEVVRSILDNHRQGRLGQPDLEYIRRKCSAEVARWFRETLVAIEAGRQLEAEPVVKALPPVPPPTSSPDDQAAAATETSEDWIARFWDDAGLVSDEVLRVAYARLLVGEAKRPGTCSMQTLKVLRYLDHETANVFARVVPRVLDDGWVSIDDLKINSVYWSSVLDLDAAGLISAPSARTEIINRKRPHWVNYPGLRGRFPESKTTILEIPVYCLTRAGTDLYRVAEPKGSREQFFQVLRSITNQAHEVGYRAQWRLTSDAEDDWKPVPDV